ncbi:hypothetical protein YC2023_122554 [Brassica napus]
MRLSLSTRFSHYFPLVEPELASAAWLFCRRRMAFSSPLLLCLLSPLPMICGLLSRKSSLDDRFTAGLDGCLTLWCDYEVGKWRGSEAAFLGFEWVQFFLFSDSLSRDSGACGG